MLTRYATFRTTHHQMSKCLALWAWRDKPVLHRLTRAHGRSSLTKWGVPPETAIPARARTLGYGPPWAFVTWSIYDCGTPVVPHLTKKERAHRSVHPFELLNRSWKT